MDDVMFDPGKILNIGGFRILLNAYAAQNRSMAMEIFRDQIYERHFAIANNDLVIDLGANVGMFSIYASSRTQNRVYAVEPLRENLTVLRSNIRDNGCQNIKILPVAVAGVGGFREMLVCSAGSMGTFSAAIYPSALRINVQCITLMELMQREEIQHIDFLKMDIEGAESDILLGLDDETWSKISKIAMEWHGVCFSGHPALEIDREEGLLQLLEQKGFSTAYESIHPQYGMVYGWRTKKQRRNYSMILTSKHMDATRDLVGKAFGFDGNLGVPMRDRVVYIKDGEVLGHASIAMQGSKSVPIGRIGWVAADGGLAGENLAPLLAEAEKEIAKRKGKIAILRVDNKTPFLACGYGDFGNFVAKALTNKLDDAKIRRIIETL